jgi:thymidine kinase
MTRQNPSFVITWVILTPIKGKFFRKNINEISKHIHSISKRIGVNEGSAHFPNKEKAIEQLNKLKLSKDFEAVFITDFQFGKSKWNESLKNVATKKQLEEKIIINKL